MTNLSKFFYPKSICLPGASTKEKSIGYELLKTIKHFGFKGEIFPVNPKADEVLGIKCYRSIEEINSKIDLAVVAVPKKFVLDTIDSLLAKGVKAIILITAGFKEIGKEGEILEKQLLEKVKSAGAFLVGPNCMGAISTLEDIKLNATFVAEKPEQGSTAFLSQSGALGAAVLNSLRESYIKFAHFISVGNKADLNENDFLKYWQGDKNIESVAMYLESFEDGEGLIKCILNGEINKPLIILKAGRTGSGMKAAQSHTGALGSQDRVVSNIMNQFGIIRADNLNDLFNSAKGFENFSMPKGNRIGVITNAGGPAILAVDSLEKNNLCLAEFEDSTKEKLREIVHPEGSVNNPVDLLPGGNADNYKLVNEIVLEDNNVDAIISIFVEPVMVKPMPVVEGINSIESDKPILQVVMPLPEFWKNYESESKSKRPIFRNPEDPSVVLSNMIFFQQKRKKLELNNFAKVNRSNESNGLNGNGFLKTDEARELFAEYKIPLIKEYFFKPNEPLLIREETYPLVIKGLSKEIIHKSEMSAVRLNIKDHSELLIAATEMKNNFTSSGIIVEEFQIQQFADTKHELLIGGFRDPSFGPIIMFGSGGKYVEVWNDTSLRSAYLSQEDIQEMIDETKIGQLLKGVRGDEPVNIVALKNIIKSCAEMMIQNPQIREFDINPLILDKNNEYFAVDYRVKI